MHPNASERIRTHPNGFEPVRTGPSKSNDILQKFRESLSQILRIKHNIANKNKNVNETAETTWGGNAASGSFAFVPIFLLVIIYV